MKTWGILFVVSLSLLGCAGALPFHRGAANEIAIVAVELPDFCLRKVETQSDFAQIRPDIQTVVAQNCARQDGMGDAPVVWISVDHNLTVADMARQVDERAVQVFTISTTRMGTPSKTLKDFVEEAKKNVDRPIQIFGHADTNSSVKRRDKQALARANAVADFLVKQGIDRSRLRTQKSDELTSSAEVVMTLIVIGQK